jgi:hypothetical protein
MPFVVRCLSAAPPFESPFGPRRHRDYGTKREAVAASFGYPGGHIRKYFYDIRISSNRYE